MSTHINLSTHQKGSKTYIKATDNTSEVSFRKYRAGVYTLGKQQLLAFLQQNRSSLINSQFSDSALKVLIAVAENEGCLDAVNTFDNSFLSYGIFQWTLGASTNKGELAALLKKLKTADAATFQTCFGQYGLDISSNTNKTYGYLTHNGQAVQSVASKTNFRSADWAFRFWKAGHNNTVKKIQAQHAIDRLHTFYWRKTAHGFPLSKIITSEYGVALILDNHVNRPSYVAKCVAKAMSAAGLTDPTTWTTEEESKVIQSYLTIRNTFGHSPMTDAAKRANSTTRFLTQGTISNARGSFRLGARTRGMTIGEVPSFVDLSEYEEIQAVIEERLESRE